MSKHNGMYFDLRKTITPEYAVREEYLRNESQEIANKDKEIRRLKRTLYKALANWAHEAKFDYDDEFSLWDKMEQKCLKESKQYKEDS